MVGNLGGQGNNMWLHWAPGGKMSINVGIPVVQEQGIVVFFGMSHQLQTDVLLQLALNGAVFNIHCVEL